MFNVTIKMNHEEQSVFVGNFSFESPNGDGILKMKDKHCISFGRCFAL